MEAFPLGGKEGSMPRSRPPYAAGFRHLERDAELTVSSSHDPFGVGGALWGAAHPAGSGFPYLSIALEQKTASRFLFSPHCCAVTFGENHVCEIATA